MTPDVFQEDGRTHHGWMVNMESESQGYDSRASGFDSNLIPELPYRIRPGDAIIKSSSVYPYNESCRPCLQATVVLTVLEKVPPEGGKNMFRPPFFGNERASYFVDNINPDLLPSLEPPKISSVPSLDWVYNRFKLMQLDVDSYPSENIRAVDNFCGGVVGTSCSYGGRVALDIGDGALRLMLNDSYEDKKPALINFLQMGIDLYHEMKNGCTWEGNGGHGSGRKLPMIMTAILLENETMEQDILSQPETTFQEDDYVFYSDKAGDGGMVLFGDSLASEFTYWYVVVEDGHQRTAGDPYRYIDCGHVPGTSYQADINSMIWKGPLVAQAVWPEVYRLWNNSMFIEYVDRWVYYGTQAQPDPCAPVMGRCVGGARDGQICTYATASDGGLSVPENESFCGENGECAGGRCQDASPYSGQLCSYEVSPSGESATCGYQPNGNDYRCYPNPEFYGVTYGPDSSNPRGCIYDTDPSDGIGRFPREHLQRADTGGYHSAFVNAMWKIYRHQNCYNGIKDFDEEGVDCGGSCVMDKDYDGYSVGYCDTSIVIDCDDANENINPDIEEICNKIGEYDDDCDGLMHDSYYLDGDLDGVNDCEDNCESDCNPMQEDSDFDGIGDACDTNFGIIENFNDFLNISLPSPVSGIKLEIVNGSAYIGPTGCCNYPGNPALALSSSDYNQLNLVIIDNGYQAWSSYTLNLIIGRGYAHGGPVFHYQDKDNYYRIDLQTSSLERVEDGVVTTITGFGESISMPWDRLYANYTIESIVTDEVTFIVTKNNTATRTFTDSNPHVKNGTIGFYDLGTSQYNFFMFDNIEIFFDNEYTGPKGICEEGGNLITGDVVSPAPVDSGGGGLIGFVNGVINDLFFDKGE